MYKTIVTAETVHQNLGRPDWIVFDCRFNLMAPEAGQQAYCLHHIPGAGYLHLDKDLSSPITACSGRHPLPDPTQLGRTLAAAGVTEQTQVVVYDDCGGAMAARAWWLLRWLGHAAVAVLDGGYSAWEHKFPCSADLPVKNPATFSGEQKPPMTVDVEQLQASLAAAEILLVDARSTERFKGEAEPIDPVAGHVPGAINRPLTDNLDNGHFKSAHQLKSEWLSLLQGTEPDSVVHMCGSGVTACHNQLAMEIAGLSGSRIYPGSWSEWVRDAARPVVNGEG